VSHDCNTKMYGLLRSQRILTLTVSWYTQKSVDLAVSACVMSIAHYEMCELWNHDKKAKAFRYFLMKKASVNGVISLNKKVSGTISDSAIAHKHFLMRGQSTREHDLCGEIYTPGESTGLKNVTREWISVLRRKFTESYWRRHM